jgi:hypothetical protein
MSVIVCFTPTAFYRVFGPVRERARRCFQHERPIDPRRLGWGVGMRAQYDLMCGHCGDHGMCRALGPEYGSPPVC